MPTDVTPASDIRAFLAAANNAAALAALGAVATARSGNTSVSASVTFGGNTSAAVGKPMGTVKITLGAGSGAYTRKVILPTTNAVENDLIKVAVYFAASTNPTLSIRNATDAGTELKAVSGQATAGKGDLWFRFDGTAWVTEGFNEVAFESAGGDTTAPALASSSPLTPADDATGVSISANLTATFTEAVEFHTAVAIAIKLTSDDTTFEAFDETDIGTLISISGSTLTINPTSSLANNVGYYVTIGATSIKDTAGNYFAGISSKTVWNFTTVASGSGLPGTPAVVYDPRLLSYAGDTPIDNTSNKMTDTSAAGTNPGVQSTSGARPLVKTSTSESGSARTLLFSPTGTPDSLVLTTPISLTGEFTIGIKCKLNTRDGALVTNAGVSAYVLGVWTEDNLGAISASATEVATDVFSVTTAEVSTGGKYHSAPSGVFHNNGSPGNATFTTTIDGDGAIDSVTIGGTNTGYTGTVTAVITQAPVAMLRTVSAKSPSLSTNIANGSFHNFILTRDDANLVTWYLNGSSVGTATVSGTLSLGELCAYLDGYLEAFFAYTSDETSNLAACNTWLA